MANERVACDGVGVMQGWLGAGTVRDRVVVRRGNSGMTLVVDKKRFTWMS